MMRNVSHARLLELLAAASKAKEKAYAPYSRFKVGAAVLAGERTFIGVNVENAAYPLSVCAERNAIARAAAEGIERIDAVAVKGSGPRPTAPCGGCRQVIWEFCKKDRGIPIIYAGAGDASETRAIGDLLPHPFGPEDLAPGPAARKRRGRGAV
jgi:cytidine deaminase